MAYPKPTISLPSEDEILEMLKNAVMDNETSFETSDGCMVEPDGICEHGHPTWLVRFGLI
ncbi:MAG: hypothetical protein JRN42_08175 [Nitrososphaerota archaeon]|nr:hypothetical protein [Nitrososphaerota archaeon]